MQRRRRKSEKSDEVVVVGFQAQKPQESSTTAIQNTPVIYFQKNRPTHISQTPKNTSKHHTHHCFSQQITSQKQPKRCPGQRHPKPACGSVSHKLSTPQGGGSALNTLQKKTHEILHGADDLQKKKKGTNYKTHRELPTCLAIRAILCCVCMFVSPPRTNNPKGRTNIHTITYNIPTATSTKKIRLKRLDRRNRQTRKEQLRRQGPKTDPERGENNRKQNDISPINTKRNPIEEEESAPSLV